MITPLWKIVYNVMTRRPFCKCSSENKNAYDAYCLRVAETVENSVAEEVEYEEAKKKVAELEKQRKTSVGLKKGKS